MFHSQKALEFMSSSTCVVWKPQLFIQWTGSCELPPTSSLGHCTFGDNLSLFLLQLCVSAQLLIQGHKSKEPSKCSVILGKELSNTLPLSIASPKHSLSRRYPERVDCSEGPSHTRSCCLLLRFLVPDYKGCRWRAVNEFSSSTGSHVSPACVHWPFPLWNHTLTRPHTHTHPHPHLCYQSRIPRHWQLYPLSFWAYLFLPEFLIIVSPFG